jgi:hypothetical protein
MQMPMTTVTDHLPSWLNIREQFRNKPDLGLLLGNGASQGLWAKFAYSSLYDIARDPLRASLQISFLHVPGGVT